MSEKKNKGNPSRFISRIECSQMMGQVNTELKTIKTALVGEDLRSGLVKDIADIKGELKNKACKEDITQLQQKGQLSGRDKTLIIVAVIGVVGSIITAIVSYLKP